MNIFGILFNTQSQTFEKLVALDLIKLWHDVPELRYMITPNTLRVLSNNEEVKTKYGLPNEFYLISPTGGFYENLSFNGWRVLDSLEYFNGLIIFEHYESIMANISRASYLSKLKKANFKFIFHGNDWGAYLRQDVGTFAEKFNGKIESITFPEMEELDRGLPIPVFGKFCFPKLIKLTAEVTDEYKICAIAPRLEELAIVKRVNPQGLSLKNPIIFDQFKIPKLIRPSSLDILKHLTINDISNGQMILEKWWLPNLQTLKINRCKMNSIREFKLPNLLTLEIHDSELREISDLKLDSLMIFSIHLITDGSVKDTDLVRVDHNSTFQLTNIDAQNLKTFSLISVYEIQTIRNLNSPNLEIADFQARYNGCTGSCNNQNIPSLGKDLFENSKSLRKLYLRNFTNILSHTLIIPNLEMLKISNDDPKLMGVKLETVFPRLKVLDLYKQFFDERRPFFTKSPDLKKISVIHCPSFKPRVLVSNNWKIETLLIHLSDGVAELGYMKDMRIPNLERLEISFVSGSLSIYNCYFDNVKILKIHKTGERQKRIPNGSINLCGIQAPNLESLILGGTMITCPLSLNSFPKLREHFID